MATGGRFLAAQPSSEHAGVIEDQHVAGAEEVAQVGETPVRHLAGRTVKHKEAGAIPGACGRLRDKLGRQGKIEVSGFQRWWGERGRWGERSEPQGKESVSAG